MTDRTKAERALAFLIHEIRGDWDEHGVNTVLRKCSDKPLPDVVAAALDCATRRHDQRTPACIALEGEHWRALVNMAGAGTSMATPQPPYFAHVVIPAEPHPVTDPARIRELRMAAKVEATQRRAEAEPA
jgi:hypothetical protein